MKKYNALLIAMLATIGLSACDRDAAESTAPAAVEEATMSDAVEQAASDAQEAVGEVMETAEEAAGDAIDSAQEAAEGAVEEASDAMDEMLEE
jgi:uncharacterized protein YjbJ (UPF0337 family)